MNASRRALPHDAVRARIDAFFDGGDPNPLHGRAAAQDAAALWQTADPETDIEAAYLLGTFHWYRHQTTLDDDIPPTEYEPAVAPLAIAYQADPELVPDPLHDFFARALAEGKLRLNANAQTYRAGQLLGQYERTGLLATLAGAVEHFRCALAATSQDSPERSGRLSNLCVVLRMAADHSDPAVMLAEAVEVGRAAVALAPDAEDRVTAQANLASALAEQFTQTGERAQIRAAVELGRATVAATPPGRMRARHLANLAGFLLALYRNDDWLDTLTEAVQTARDAVAGFGPDAPDRETALSFLSDCLEEFATRTTDASAMNEAVATARIALADCPKEGHRHAACVSRLADRLLSRFQLTGDAASIREAVPLARTAVAESALDGTFRAVRLGKLSRTLAAMYELTGESELLAECVDVQRIAIARAGPQQPGYGVYLCDLGMHLAELAEYTGDRDTLDEAVATLRAGLAATPADLPDRSRHLRGLSYALESRSARTGDPGDLDEALATARSALAALPAGHPEVGDFQSSLAGALDEVFLRTGDAAFLEEAADLLRAAIAAARPEDPFLPLELNNLGRTLIRLFELRGDAKPLMEAVAAHRAALAAVGASSPHRTAFVSGLANALARLAERTDEMSLLIEAVDLLRAVTVEADPDEPLDLVCWHNLAVRLTSLYDATGDTALLDEAVAAHRAVVAATPADNPALTLYLGGLGNALLMLGRHAGRADAVGQAVAAQRSALAATPPQHADRGLRLHNLGNALWARYLETADPEFQREAESCYTEAGGSMAAPVGRRISSYRALSRVMLEGPRSEAGALAAIEAAVELLPQAAARSLGRRDREYVHRQWSALPGWAAAVAVAAERPDRAVELLEQTRGLLVADAVSARGGESARLRARDPALADAFDALQVRLAALESSDGAMAGARMVAAAAEAHALRAADHARDAERARDRARRDAYAEWERLLVRIRGLDGFTDFLRPTDFSTLITQVCEGPVVFVYATSIRSDALIVSAEEFGPVRVVPLPRLSPEEVVRQAERLTTACRAARFRDADLDVTAAEQLAADSGVVHSILAWLWDTVAGPVLEALGHTSGPEQPELAESWPRVWWCPIGPLAYLPFHAAGHHVADHHAVAVGAAGPGVSGARGGPGAPRTVLDRVVSSYTTTIRSLTSGSAKPAPPCSPGPLIVTIPDAPSTEPLPGATAEAALIKALIPAAHVLPHPTRETLLDLLPRHRVAHFACHGATNWADQETAPLTVLDISSLELDADLAYLSACSTTVTNLALADEAVHVTSAFHLAGYRHVVGTLWAAADQASAHFAGVFYHGLLRSDGTLDTGHAAFALHQATHAMRARCLQTPELWAGFTHTGG